MADSHLIRLLVNKLSVQLDKLSGSEESGSSGVPKIGPYVDSVAAALVRYARHYYNRVIIMVASLVDRELLARPTSVADSARQLYLLRLVARCLAAAEEDVETDVHIENDSFDFNKVLAPRLTLPPEQPEAEVINHVFDLVVPLFLLRPKYLADELTEVAQRLIYLCSAYDHATLSKRVQGPLLFLLTAVSPHTNEVISLSADRLTMIPVSLMMLPCLHLDGRRLSDLAGILSKVFPLLHRIDASAYCEEPLPALASRVLHSCIWRWVTFKPAEFVALSRSEGHMRGSPSSLFDAVFVWPYHAIVTKTNKLKGANLLKSSKLRARKSVTKHDLLPANIVANQALPVRALTGQLEDLYSALATIALLCPDLLLQSLHRSRRESTKGVSMLGDKNRAPTTGDRVHAFLDHITRIMNAFTKLNETDRKAALAECPLVSAAAAAFTILIKASTFVDKSDMSALRFLVPSMESSVADVLLSSTDDGAEQRLTEFCLASFRLNRVTNISSLLPRLLSIDAAAWHQCAGVRALANAAHTAALLTAAGYSSSASIDPSVTGLAAVRPPASWSIGINDVRPALRSTVLQLASACASTQNIMRANFHLRTALDQLLRLFCVDPLMLLALPPVEPANPLSIGDVNVHHSDRLATIRQTVAMLCNALRSCASYIPAATAVEEPSESHRKLKVGSLTDATYVNSLLHPPANTALETLIDRHRANTERGDADRSYNVDGLLECGRLLHWIMSPATAAEYWFPGELVHRKCCDEEDKTPPTPTSVLPDSLADIPSEFGVVRTPTIVKTHAVDPLSAIACGEVPDDDWETSTVDSAFESEIPPTPPAALSSNVLDELAGASDVERQDALHISSLDAYLNVLADYIAAIARHLGAPHVFAMPMTAVESVCLLAGDVIRQSVSVLDALLASRRASELNRAVERTSQSVMRALGELEACFVVLLALPDVNILSAIVGLLSGFCDLINVLPLSHLQTESMNRAMNSTVLPATRNYMLYSHVVAVSQAVLSPLSGERKNDRRDSVPAIAGQVVLSVAASKSEVEAACSSLWLQIIDILRRSQQATVGQRKAFGDLFRVFAELATAISTGDWVSGLSSDLLVLTQPVKRKLFKSVTAVLCAVSFAAPPRMLSRAGDDASMDARGSRSPFIPYLLSFLDISSLSTRRDVSSTLGRSLSPLSFTALFHEIQQHLQQYVVTTGDVRITETSTTFAMEAIRVIGAIIGGLAEESPRMNSRVKSIGKLGSREALLEDIGISASENPRVPFLGDRHVLNREINSFLSTMSAYASRTVLALATPSGIRLRRGFALLVALTFASRAGTTEVDASLRLRTLNHLVEWVSSADLLLQAHANEGTETRQILTSTMYEAATEAPLPPRARVPRLVVEDLQQMIAAALGAVEELLHGFELIPTSDVELIMAYSSSEGAEDPTAVRGARRRVNEGQDALTRYFNCLAKRLAFPGVTAYDETVAALTALLEGNLITALPSFLSFAYQESFGQRYEFLVIIGHAVARDTLRHSAVREKAECIADDPEAQLHRVVFAPPYDLPTALLLATDQGSRDPVARALMACGTDQDILALIRRLIAVEIRSVTNTATIFRHNTACSQFIGSYFAVRGRGFLRSFLKPLWSSIVSANVEIEPRRVAAELGIRDVNDTAVKEAVDQNAAELSRVVAMILESFSSSVLAARSPSSSTVALPRELVHVCAAAAHWIRATFPSEGQSIIYPGMAGFLFLRFLCPAILAPLGYGIVARAPSVPERRGLTLISKVIQNVANGVVRSGKEPWMSVMASFVESAIPGVRTLFEVAASPEFFVLDDSRLPGDPPVWFDSGEGEIRDEAERSLSILHSMISKLNASQTLGVSLSAATREVYIDDVIVTALQHKESELASLLESTADKLEGVQSSTQASATADALSTAIARLVELSKGTTSIRDPTVVSSHLERALSMLVEPEAASRGSARPMEALSTQLQQFLAQSATVDTEAVESARVFVRVPGTLESGRPLFVWVLRNYHDDLGSIALLSHIFRMLRKVWADQYEVIIDCTGYEKSAELGVDWLRQFLFYLPKVAVRNLACLHVLHLPLSLHHAIKRRARTFSGVIGHVSSVLNFHSSVSDLTEQLPSVHEHLSEETLLLGAAAMDTYTSLRLHKGGFRGSEREAIITINHRAIAVRQVVKAAVGASDHVCVVDFIPLAAIVSARSITHRGSTELYIAFRPVGLDSSMLFSGEIPKPMKIPHGCSVVCLSSSSAICADLASTITGVVDAHVPKNQATAGAVREKLFTLRPLPVIESELLLLSTLNLASDETAVRMAALRLLTQTAVVFGLPSTCCAAWSALAASNRLSTVEQEAPDIAAVRSVFSAYRHGHVSNVPVPLVAAGRMVSRIAKCLVSDAPELAEHLVSEAVRTLPSLSSSQYVHVFATISPWIVYVASTELGEGGAINYFPVMITSLVEAAARFMDDEGAREAINTHCFKPLADLGSNVIVATAIVLLSIVEKSISTQDLADGTGFSSESVPTALSSAVSFIFVILADHDNNVVGNLLIDRLCRYIKIATISQRAHEVSVYPMLCILNVLLAELLFDGRIDVLSCLPRLLFAELMLAGLGPDRTLHVSVRETLSTLLRASSMNPLFTSSVSGQCELVSDASRHLGDLASVLVPTPDKKAKIPHMHVHNRNESLVPDLSMISATMSMTSRARSETLSLFSRTTSPNPLSLTLPEMHSTPHSTPVSPRETNAEISDSTSCPGVFTALCDGVQAPEPMGASDAAHVTSLLLRLLDLLLLNVPTSIHATRDVLRRAVCAIAFNTTGDFSPVGGVEVAMAERLNITLLLPPTEVHPASEIRVRAVSAVGLLVKRGTHLHSVMKDLCGILGEWSEDLVRVQVNGLPGRLSRKSRRSTHGREARASMSSTLSSLTEFSRVKSVPAILDNPLAYDHLPTAAISSLSRVVVNVLPQHQSVGHVLFWLGLGLVPATSGRLRVAALDLTRMATASIEQWSLVPRGAKAPQREVEALGAVPAVLLHMSSGDSLTAETVSHVAAARQQVEEAIGVSFEHNFSFGVVTALLPALVGDDEVAQTGAVNLILQLARLGAHGRARSRALLGFVVALLLGGSQRSLQVLAQHLTSSTAPETDGLAARSPFCHLGGKGLRRNTTQKKVSSAFLPGIAHGAAALSAMANKSVSLSPSEPPLMGNLSPSTGREVKRTVVLSSNQNPCDLVGGLALRPAFIPDAETAALIAITCQWFLAKVTKQEDRMKAYKVLSTVASEVPADSCVSFGILLPSLEAAIGSSSSEEGLSEEGAAALDLISLIASQRANQAAESRSSGDLSPLRSRLKGSLLNVGSGQSALSDESMRYASDLVLNRGFNGLLFMASEDPANLVRASSVDAVVACVNSLLAVQEK